MKANPEIIMVDKLNGKDFKLGEYELDDETGALYVGTHGTVFPGGSANTGGGGGGSGSNEEGGFISGFNKTEIKYMFKFQPVIKFNVESSVDLNPNVDFVFTSIEKYILKSIKPNFTPIATINHIFVNV